MPALYDDLHAHSKYIHSTGNTCWSEQHQALSVCGHQVPAVHGHRVLSMCPSSVCVSLCELSVSLTLRDRKCVHHTLRSRAAKRSLRVSVKKSTRRTAAASSRPPARQEYKA